MTSNVSSWDDYLKQIQGCKDINTLENLEQGLFGRKSGTMTLAMQSLRDVPEAKRKEVAKDLNDWKKKLDHAIEERKQQCKNEKLSDLGKNDPFDVTLSLPERSHGHLHLIPEFIRQVEEVFGRMGFDTASGPEIESEDYNFNFLNIPETHPARDAQDTFQIQSSKKGKDRLVLRTHTSPVQIRYMQEHKPPFRAIFPGKVYRKDADATHSPMFHQFEGLMIGEDISLANMKAVMVTAIRELIAQDAEFRFRTGFFPFVEPGLEVDMRWQGDEEESREGKWLEVVGCGMVHPQVLKNVGIDSTKWQGFAFGFGIERMLMIKHQIPDLRSFYQGDVRFLKQF